MKVNTTKIMKSHYDSDYMGSGKSNNAKRRMKNMLNAKVKRMLDKIFNDNHETE